VPKVLKILAFSDLHCNADAATEIARTAPSVDWVIGAGDFAIMRRGLAKTIDILRTIDRPTLIVPGNGESLDELRAACAGWPAVQVLHGSGVQIDGVPVFGIGGAIPTTPFGSWSYDFSEQEAEEMLAECPSKCVLISHSPPYGIVDRSALGQNLGSKSVRAAIEKFSPHLVICGHIHDSWQQQQMLGSTLVINAGPSGQRIELTID
jgi:uncharacterized protein